MVGRHRKLHDLACATLPWLPGTPFLEKTSGNEADQSRQGTAPAALFCPPPKTEPLVCIGDTLEAFIECSSVPIPRTPPFPLICMVRRRFFSNDSQPIRIGAWRRQQGYFPSSTSLEQTAYEGFPGFASLAKRLLPKTESAPHSRPFPQTSGLHSSAKFPTSTPAGSPEQLKCDTFGLHCP